MCTTIRAITGCGLTAAVIVAICVGSRAVADGAADDPRLAQSFVDNVRPLLQRYCFACHSGDTIEADLDLSAFAVVNDVREQLPAWLKIRQMLDSGQMPPPDAPQPIGSEQAALQTWVRDFLAREARAHAGDPGPVVLRRLNNEEYNYTIQDLTGVTSLDPTREFPVDGAAGEGFINSGAGQSMSPALVQKYFDAAKEIAEHLVLLPDGIMFSPHTTRRDQTDENLARIQAFYRRFTADGGGQTVNLQGIQFDTNQGGLLPLERYLLATLEERVALSSGDKSIDDVARERSLSPKYLASLWRMLTAAGDEPSFLLADVRQLWEQTTVTDVAQLTAHVSAVQEPLWRFNVIGHIGDDGLPPTWLAPMNPLVAGREFSLPLSETKQDVTVTLAAAGVEGDLQNTAVVWENPRLTGGGVDIPISQLAALQNRIDELRRAELARTSAYLAAADEAAAVLPGSAAKPDDIAARHNVSEHTLRSWLNFLGIDEPGAVRVTGHFTERHTSSDYRFVAGWGTPATPLIVANASENEVRIPGIARPRAVLVHPSQTEFAAIGWQSPLTGMIQMEARIADAHPECGNGQEWLVQHRSQDRIRNLGQGIFGSGGSGELPSVTVSVRSGEVISLVVGPRDATHACDLTEVSLVITEQEGEQRVWDLAKEVSGDIQTANPRADIDGNPRTWHFYHGAMDSVDRREAKPHGIPSGSLLAQWKNEADADRRAELAEQMQALMTGDEPHNPQSADSMLFSRIVELISPIGRVEELLLDLPRDERFGRRIEGTALSSDDLLVRVPNAVKFRIPAELAEGRTFVTRGRVESRSVGGGSVRIEASLTPLAPADIPLASPVVVSDDSAAHNRVEAAFDDFRQLFAPALCYARIVPVDEVVTITLFYRQDDVLQRFMLNDEQKAELERLWDVLLYVSQEPLQYQTAFEMTQAFATQDRPDLVKKWAPLAEAVAARAERFRQRLLDSQPVHLDALLAFADRAWRRELSSAEQSRLRQLYDELRQSDLTHEAAMRLTLARILTSPAFLYRREQPGEGSEAVPLTGTELAGRLSYFLWSSLPDDTLRETAAAGRLTDDDVLLQQTRRMLAVQRTRRLAEQFACQWLHLRDFDQNDDKNEALYPQFAELRGDMYEETVLFFEDMFRNNRSILSLLDADHTFVNASLAEHYGIVGVTGPGWQRIADLRSVGRGGLLGMATVLASQSGASRTSPILRGNWISETLLGERLPKPPPNVPQLPETVPDGLTTRELIELHSSVAECARCHAKIDPYGFSLEQFDAIGRLRPQAVDTQTTLFDGESIDGMEGLRAYLRNVRQVDVVRQFCRKLLGFALGREIQLSDEPLLDTMVGRLQEGSHRFHMAVELIVLSPQFRQIRGVPSAE